MMVDFSNNGGWNEKDLYNNDGWRKMVITKIMRIMVEIKRISTTKMVEGKGFFQ